MIAIVLGLQRLIFVLGFCALCAVVVVVLSVQALCEWIKLRREEREAHGQWEWEFRMGLTSQPFDEWRRNPAIDRLRRREERGAR